ncbi:MAG: hypothetical protein AAGH41_03625 [Pseudomonadota bacterium]
MVTDKRRRFAQSLGRAAPELARALGGPLAGAAVGLISKALLGREEDDADVLEAALETASPEALVRLREANMSFQKAVLDAANEGARIAASDRADARARQRALKDRIPGCLAFTVVAGFFGVLAAMLVADVPADAETEFSIMLGALATMAAAVMNYYFGSSAGSRVKTELLEGRRSG